MEKVAERKKKNRINFFFCSGGFYSDGPASDQQDNPFQTVATKSQTRHWNLQF